MSDPPSKSDGVSQRELVREGVVGAIQRVRVTQGDILFGEEVDHEATAGIECMAGGQIERVTLSAGV